MRIDSVWFNATDGVGENSYNGDCSKGLPNPILFTLWPRKACNQMRFRMTVNVIATLVMASLVLVCFIYEVYAYIWGGEGSTISSVTRAWVCRYPVIAVFIGMLVYHLVGECPEYHRDSINPLIKPPAVHPNMPKDRQSSKSNPNEDNRPLVPKMHGL